MWAGRKSPIASSSVSAMCISRQTQIWSRLFSTSSSLNPAPDMVSRYSSIFSPVALHEAPRMSTGRPILAISTSEASPVQARASGGWGFW